MNVHWNKKYAHFFGAPLLPDARKFPYLQGHSELRGMTGDFFPNIFPPLNFLSCGKTFSYPIPLIPFMSTDKII